MFEDALDHHRDLRAGAVPQGVVHGHAAPHAGHRFSGDDAEFLVVHGLHGALVGRQSVVDGDLVGVRPWLRDPLGFSHGTYTSLRPSVAPPSSTHQRIGRDVEERKFRRQLLLPKFASGFRVSQFLRGLHGVKAPSAVRSATTSPGVSCTCSHKYQAFLTRVPVRLQAAGICLLVVELSGWNVSTPSRSLRASR